MCNFVILKWKNFFFSGQPFTKWRDYLDVVVNTINNHNKKIFKSLQNQLLAYFTQEQQIIPQLNSKMFKFNVNDIVGLDASSRQRKELGFKYSLNRGGYKRKKKIKIFMYLIKIPA